MAHKQNGKWRVRWSRNGRRYSKTLPEGTSRQAAEAFERKARSGAIASHLFDPEIPTFAEYAERWFEVYPTMKPREESTRKKDRQVLRDHLIPAFGEMLVCEVKARDILDFQTEMVEMGYQPQSVRNTLATLSNIFKLACLEDIIPANPVTSVPRVKSETRKPTFWTFEEADRFLCHAQDADWEIFQLCAFALNTGLRPGELQALQADCLDFRNQCVHVRRNWCTKTNQIRNYTKNKVERTIWINDEIMRVMLNKRGLRGDERVFPLPFNTLGFRRIRPLAEEAGVKPIRFHDLRHTFASHLAMQGKSAIEIRDLLGHKKLSSTDIYMHLTEDFRKGATAGLTTGMSWVKSIDSKVVAIGG